MFLLSKSKNPKKIMEKAECPICRGIIIINLEV